MGQTIIVKKKVKVTWHDRINNKVEARCNLPNYLFFKGDNIKIIVTKQKDPTNV